MIKPPRRLLAMLPSHRPAYKVWLVKSLNRLAHRGRVLLANQISEARADRRATDPIAQLQLQLSYSALKESGRTLPGLGEVGFKAFSQTDEDGILLYIFSLIGSVSRKSVEICSGDGIECNTANLIINHGWHGLLIDGDEELVRNGTEFYSKNPNTRIYPPVFAHSWITRDNVNNVIAGNGFSGNVDLLSIDMDGVDYWIWDAINCIDPRVVVVEYQDIIGPNRSCTVPYSDSFNAYQYPTTRGMPNFCGASLSAFVKLARSRGYRLVGCNRYGFNAFFIKNPLGESELPAIDIEECFSHPKVVWGMKERFPLVKDFPWVEV
jgi:hypothetical protein